VKLGSYSFKSIDAILKNNLDQQPLMPPEAAPLPKVAHANVRGADFFAAPTSSKESEGSRAC